MVEASMPPMTALPRICRESAPEPVAIASGTQPRMNANEVIKMGRRRRRAPSRAASCDGLVAFLKLHARELDDQDRVLRRKTDQHDETDLRVNVVVHVAQLAERQERAEHRHRRREQGR